MRVVIVLLGLLLGCPPNSVLAQEKNLPLEEGRTFNITATEGSWMSLDISPDGQQLVFDFLGDLYLMPFSGGEAEALTSGFPFDAQPRFSPDGKSVVFTSDKGGGEGIWVMDLATREPRQLTKGKTDRYQSPEWTPDGKYIVASKAGVRGGTLKLWLYHVDGGTGVKLMDKPDDLKMTGAAFGAEGRYIWFAERTGDWQYNAIFPQYQIARYDRETGARETMTFNYGSGIRPTLSPDGQWLVYGTRFDGDTGLRLRNLASGDERWLAYPIQHDDQESRGTRDVLPGMSFTPDSKNLVCSWGGKIWQVPISGAAASEIPFRVNATLPLGPQLDFDYPIEDSPTFVVKQIRDAVPSPDGKKLAFVALDRIYVMNFPEGEPRLVNDLELSQAQPAWSPDGRELVFTTWNETAGGHLYRTNLQSGATQKITTDPALYNQPTWSPDGQRIVVLRGPAQNFKNAITQGARGVDRELIWISAGGGTPNLIAAAAGRSHPHFSKEFPERIFLFHPRQGLSSVRWDGTDPRAHVKITGPKPPGFDQPLDASLILMAPSGDQALALVYNDVYVVTVPQVSDQAPVIAVANPENAAFPATKLTDIGGQFPTWGENASKVHWSIGNAHVVYDLAAARQKAINQDTVAYVPLEQQIQVQANRDMPNGNILFRGATLITMKGDEIIEKGDLLVVNNRIKALGKKGSFPVPAGTRIMDVSGKVIIPGFVDTHAHLRPTFNIHKEEVWAYAANLAYGVTTTRDPQTGTTDVLSYEDQVRAGNIPGPRIYSTGPGMFWQEQITDLDHARKIVSRYSKYYDTKTLKMYVAGNRQQRQWIIMACREQQIMPTTEGSLNFKQNLTQIIDGYPGHEHSFPVFPLYEDAKKLIAFSQTSYTPTLLVAYGGPWAENYFYTRENPHDDPKLARFTPHDDLDAKTLRRGQGAGPGPGGWFHDMEHVFKKQAVFVKDLVEAGGKAGVGSHGQLQGLGYHWELWAMQSGGLSPHHALQVATLQGAEAIGLEKELGSLEAGKLADLLVLDKNPLQNIRHTQAIRYVMVNGRMFEADTLTEVYPNAATQPAFELRHDFPNPKLPGLKQP